MFQAYQYGPLFYIGFFLWLVHEKLCLRNSLANDNPAINFGYFMKVLVKPCILTVFMSIECVWVLNVKSRQYCSDWNRSIREEAMNNRSIRENLFVFVLICVNIEFQFFILNLFVFVEFYENVGCSQWFD